MFALLLIACSTGAQQAWSPGELPPEEPRQPGALDISITLFDPGIPDDKSVHRDQEIYPRIREIESLFLPFVLRRTLNDTHQWGAVRVVPDSDDAAELLVTATIVRSDGEQLALNVRAVDATGRVWLDRLFSGATSENYARDERALDPAGYNALYDEIAEALLAVRKTLDARALRNIVDVSLMRYAEALVPSAFSQYLSGGDDGSYVLLRLPATNDPMLGRINRLRRVEYAITDAVDEKYEELHEEIASTYDLWRRYRREFKRYQRDEAERAAMDPSDAPRGSYESLLDRYRRYKWDRMAAQEQEDWAVGFDNEVGPTIERIEVRIDGLAGWVERETATWERILAEFYELETDFAQ